MFDSRINYSINCTLNFILYITQDSFVVYVKQLYVTVCSVFYQIYISPKYYNPYRLKRHP